MDERLDSTPFGRMILLPEGGGYDVYRQVFFLDLALGREFVGRGYVLMPPDLEHELYPQFRRAPVLQTVELTLDRETWDRIEERSALSEEDLPIEEDQVNSIDFFGEEAGTLLLLYNAYRPDPERRAYRGSFYSEPTGQVNFLLEEFGSPDPVSIILAVGFVIGLVGLLNYAHQRTCMEQAQEACQPNGIATFGSRGFGSVNADPQGPIGSSFSSECRWTCK